MKKLRRSLLALFSLVLVFGLSGVSALSEDPYFDFLEDSQPNAPDAGDPGAILANEQGVLVRLLDIFGLSGFQDGSNTVFGYITFIINILLGFAAFIAFIWLIYGFYRLFFVKYEDGISKAKDILKGASIALIVIGLSWILTRFIFWIVSLFIG